MPNIPVHATPLGNNLSPTQKKVYIAQVVLGAIGVIVQLLLVSYFITCTILGSKRCKMWAEQITKLGQKVEFEAKEGIVVEGIAWNDSGPEAQRGHCILLTRRCDLAQYEMQDLSALLTHREYRTLEVEHRKRLQEELQNRMKYHHICQHPDHIQEIRVPSKPLFTKCKHLFCRDCIERSLEDQRTRPVCRRALGDFEGCLVQPAAEAGLVLPKGWNQIGGTSLSTA